jgi:hypothetical protein
MFLRTMSAMLVKVFSRMRPRTLSGNLPEWTCQNARKANHFKIAAYVPGRNMNTNSSSKRSAQNYDTLCIQIFTGREMLDHGIGVHLDSLLIRLTIASAVPSVGHHENVCLQAAPQHMHAGQAHSHVARIFLFRESEWRKTRLNWKNEILPEKIKSSACSLNLTA